MSEPREVQRFTSSFLSCVLIALGVAITVRTLFALGDADGFPLGLLLGPLFVAAGAARLYLNRRLRR